MAANLDAFKTAFSNTYQEVFQKVTVAMAMANTRLLADLHYGKSIERVSFDLSGAIVEDITAYSDMSSQAITDTSESLTVNNNKGIMFQLSEKELVQAGPLNPAEKIGAEVAKKVGIYVDADVLAETVNAAYNFDNGDLTTGASTGTAITLNATTVPQMVMRLPAKLRKNHQSLVGLTWVIDSYGIADTFQYLLGKNADFVNSLFQNGYVNEQVAGAKVRVSENLTGTAVIGLATQPTANDTIVVNGVTFQFVATIGNPGDLHLGTAVDDTRANMVAAFNAIDTAIAEAATTGYTPVSAADQATWKAARITATNDDTADTATLVGTGSGRFVVSETFTDATDAFDANYINSYFGREGAIDVVVQKDVKADMRQEPKQPTTNIISRVLYGIKTYTDGSKKFLNVKINS
jgi:hypothetical protein